MLGKWIVKVKEVINSEYISKFVWQLKRSELIIEELSKMQKIIYGRKFLVSSHSE